MEILIPVITLDELKDATENNPELKVVLEEKWMGRKSAVMSKGPYGKIWEELQERDGLLIRNRQLVIPKVLQVQAIAIAHEGHQQTDGTLRQLRESQWFRNM